MSEIKRQFSIPMKGPPPYGTPRCRECRAVVKKGLVLCWVCREIKEAGG